MHTVDEEHVLEGRDAAIPVTILLLALAAASGFAGLAGLAAQAASGLGFWDARSPLTPLLTAAGFLGAVPMLLQAARAALWEHCRVVVVTGSVLVVGLLAVTLSTADGVAGEGPLELVWTAALLGLAGLVVVALVVQTREPALPLPRGVPLPRWSLPLLAVLGSAWLGLGAALLVRTTYWLGFVPWETSTLDARLLGCFALAFGAGVLLALAEDDLERLRPTFVSLLAIGLLGLGALVARSGEIEWRTPGALALLVLLTGLVAAGLVGRLLDVRAVHDVGSR